ncbi:hypothetical protein LXL04_012291 [Taraxacum kok-saghyz]
MKNCSKLESLNLNLCKFQGELPVSIGNLSDRLRRLDLRGNQLHGNIPSSIGNLVGLTTLILSDNQFTGKFPSTIGKLRKLQEAYLHVNQLSGPIPDAIGNLSLLTALWLHSNRLEQQIPSSLGNCHNLLELRLKDNDLSGKIPKQLLQLSSLTIALDLSQNNLSGSLPKEVGELKMLTSLYLSDNNLTGNISSSLGDCTSLSFLSLKGNLFQGIIPSSFSSMRGVSILDLSRNNLSGQIPRFLEQMVLLEYVNLSFNNFEGEVPLLRVFSNASTFSFRGIKRKVHPSQSSTSTDESFVKVSYGQLLKATNGFSEANLIGKGGFSSVYKGLFDHDDKCIAVKVVHLKNRGAQKSFVAECEAWRSIRHRNILKIITACSSVDFQGNDFKAVIYEFMSNGSLHDWLHSRASTSGLNLIQRIKVLINVASAIDYLHNHCVHVSFTSMVLGVRSQVVGMSIVSVLLLEVMMGKRPTDDIFVESLNLHKFADMALPHNVTDVIDDDLLNFEDAIDTKCTLANAKKIEECMSSIVKIGVSCSMESPPQRMNIENVVYEKYKHEVDQRVIGHPQSTSSTSGGEFSLDGWKRGPCLTESTAVILYTYLYFQFQEMNSGTALRFYNISALLITATVFASDVGNETDYQALLSFKSMITNEALSSWNSSFHFCDWSGVSCGKRHRRVTALQLSSQGLEGSLSPHVGNLSFLREFSLFNNNFQGTIPHELDRLFRLRALDLGSNKFNGVIPSNLSRCSNLEELQLGYNKLVGSIPKEISFLSKLTWIQFNDNNLTGGIPPVLGNLTSMITFSVKSNPLGGSIPDTLGDWKNLTGFYVGGCNLSGTVPLSIYNLSLLVNVSLAENQLVGSLPSTLGSMFPHLQYFQLRNNQLTGPLPSSLSNCTELVLIELNYNNFKGKVNIDFAKLKDISVIHIGNIDELGEGDDMNFVDTLKNCSKLERLDIAYCSFQGVLPGSIGNLSDQLFSLTLPGNYLYGNLPSSIGNLVGLTRISLGENQFTGNIPSTFGKLQSLQLALLHENVFSGRIPDTIGNLTLLTTLWLYSNRLEWHIPSSLGNCHRLLELYIGDNKLSGTIPKQLLQLSSLTIALDLSQNNLSGSLPTDVGDLKMLAYLDLSENLLSGNIPSSIGACTSLTFLSLKDNLFQGMVPPSLSFLRALEELDISHNNLSGPIPRYLESFTLMVLNLSFNDFEGDVPVVGVFANVTAFSVAGNNRLCGGLAELRLPKCKETRKDKKKSLLVIIFILIAFTIFSIFCIVLVYVWCKKRKSQPSPSSSTDDRFMKVSYSQLFKATNGFSEANLIGEGGFSSVYKGILDDHDERIVAVKVIHLENRGAHKSFIAECEALRSIRHRNLMKIITLCSSVDFQGNDFKALVYELMPNGSLHDWLHSSSSESRLNFLQRINILFDVACALDYLHNHCVPTVVHCDLKPSNILLDDDMVAHVGDFGLARFFGTDSKQISTSGVRGTIGYAPPEYGVGSEMTSSGDVYSFGILLLEVVTGKRPTDNIFQEGLNLHKFAYMALPDHVTDVIDDSLLTFLQEDGTRKECKLANAKEIELCIASVVKIGVACSVDSPPQRMKIENVVHELQHILDTVQIFEVQ